MTTSRAKGSEAEQHALDFLLQNQLTLVERNYNCRYGEIDLIMQDKTHLVFVEVRFRAKINYGDAATSISRSKKSKLIIKQKSN